MSYYGMKVHLFCPCQANSSIFEVNLSMRYLDLALVQLIEVLNSTVSSGTVTKLLSLFVYNYFFDCSRSQPLNIPILFIKCCLIPVVNPRNDSPKLSYKYNKPLQCYAMLACKSAKTVWGSITVINATTPLVYVIV